MNCYICDTNNLDRYTSIDVPDRANDAVYSICFACTDAYTRIFSQRIVSFLRSRELG